MSTPRLRIRLYRAAFREQVLKAPGVADACYQAAQNGAAGGKNLRAAKQTQGRTRLGATIFGKATDETNNGELTKAAGRCRL